MGPTCIKHVPQCISVLTMPTNRNSAVPHHSQTYFFDVSLRSLAALWLNLVIHKHSFSPWLILANSVLICPAFLFIIIILDVDLNTPNVSTKHVNNVQISDVFIWFKVHVYIAHITKHRFLTTMACYMEKSSRYTAILIASLTFYCRAIALIIP